MLKHDEESLSSEEKTAVESLLFLVNADPDELGTFDGDEFATGILKKRKFENKNVSSAYLDPKFLQPTSNLLERFFSTAGYAYNDYRKHLLPMNLERQLFLKLNHRFWSEATVDKVVRVC